ncbi:hypothetical protein LLG96_06120 [bacterium]|nr:hypothetical protein [bacterium]
MRPITMLSILLTLILISTVAQAQDRAFLFTLTTPECREQPMLVHYDTAYGHKTFEPFGGDDLEQNLGLQANFGKSLSLIAHFGLAMDNRTTSTSQHVELLAHLMKAEDHIIDFSAGAGVRHEYSDTDVLLSRFMLGRRFTSWQSYSNLLLEKPLSSDRDNIDLMTTVGVSYNISGALRLGIEMVGQDIEGFWEENEAEGGAVLFAGPTVGITLPWIPCTFTIGGGPIFRASKSSRTSQAYRDIPFKQGNGFVIRNMVTFGM